MVMNYNHTGKPVARTRNGSLVLTIDDTGLKVTARLGGTQEARAMYEEIKGGYMDDILFIGAAFKDVKKAARLFCAYLRDELGLEIKPIWHVKALAKEPIDIMGFVIRRDRTTVRARIFVRARRQFLRAWAYLETGGYITIKAARRIISYRGYFSHTDSVGISAKLHIVEVSRAASNVISAAARAELAAAA